MTARNNGSVCRAQEAEGASSVVFSSHADAAQAPSNPMLAAQPLEMMRVLGPCRNKRRVCGLACLCVTSANNSKRAFVSLWQLRRQTLLAADSDSEATVVGMCNEGLSQGTTTAGPAKQWIR